MCGFIGCYNGQSGVLLSAVFSLSSILIFTAFIVSNFTKHRLQ